MIPYASLQIEQHIEAFDFIFLLRKAYLLDSYKLSKIATDLIVEAQTTTEVVLRFKDEQIIAEYLHKQVLLHTLSMRQTLNLERLRKCKKDSLQAITAVHESGHAIASMLLLGKIPEVILSHTTEDDVAGWIHTKQRQKYIARHEIKKLLAVLLAGYAAEQLVFGKEHITTGTEGDLERATLFITHMLKDCGMGVAVPAAYHSDQTENNYLHDVGHENLI